MTSSSFLISAISSGSGKTMLTLGLLRALRNRGYGVQPFKCGPDYIDTKFHELASGKKSVNLDLFLSSSEHVKNIYNKYSQQADVSVIEGVMGLFDGYEKSLGSSAHIAQTLKKPIVLVLCPKSMAYSVAAILYGYKYFNPELNIVGVIFNRVNSENHYKILKDACDDLGITSLGYIPENDAFAVPSRHLGLSLEQGVLIDELAEKASNIIEKQIDIDNLLSITKTNRISASPLTSNRNITKLKSAVALDEAFSFIYKENIEYLEQRGEVAFFSPLHDEKIPEADFVYLPGGYPELYLEKLHQNKLMQQSIRDYVEHGGKLLAECGGMMYLSACIVDKDGCKYPMTGIFDQTATMQNMKLSLGYRHFELNNIKVKGHEFHYSHTEGNLKSIAQLYNAKGSEVSTKLLRYKNTIAGYTHIYWAEMDDLMTLFE